MIKNVLEGIFCLLLQYEDAIDATCNSAQLYFAHKNEYLISKIRYSFLLLNLKDAVTRDYLFRALLGYFLEICKVIHDYFFVPIIGCFPGFALRDVLKHPVAVFQKEIFPIRPRRYVIFCLSHNFTSSFYCLLMRDLVPAFSKQRSRPQIGSNFCFSYFVQFSDDD